MDSDLRLAAAIRRLMQLYQFNHANAETLARAVLEAADAAEGRKVGAAMADRA